MTDDSGAEVLAAWADSGIVSLTGHDDGPPLVPPGAAATLAARIGERLTVATSGTRHQVRLDAAALLAERAALCGLRRRGRMSAGGATRLLPTRDGWAAVSCARPIDPALLGALVGAELPEDPWPEVAAWLSSHRCADLAERAELLGLAAAAVTTTADQPARPHEGPATVPDRMASASSQGAGGARSLEAMLVVDFSALWAGPLCAHLLGLAGARIVKVETPQRPDGARRGNRTFYDLLHAGHRSVLLDPATPSGRQALAALVAAADVVIEASRPRALAGFGLDAQAAVDAGTVWVSITAAGRCSPRVGFGDDVAAGAGLIAVDDHNLPVFCGDALADPMTGLVAADRTISALRRGGGALLDIAMSEVVLSTLTFSRPLPSFPSRSPTARRLGQDWVIGTDQGPAPVAMPRARTPHSRAPGVGEHTTDVLRGLGVRRP